eukprot:2964653-Pleurochrysis_carterae.AAC.3
MPEGRLRGAERKSKQANKVGLASGSWCGKHLWRYRSGGGVMLPRRRLDRAGRQATARWCCGCLKRANGSQARQVACAATACMYRLVVWDVERVRLFVKCAALPRLHRRAGPHHQSDAMDTVGLDWLRAATVDALLIVETSTSWHWGALAQHLAAEDQTPPQYLAVHSSTLAVALYASLSKACSLSL